MYLFIVSLVLYLFSVYYVFTLVLILFSVKDSSICVPRSTTTVVATVNEEINKVLNYILRFCLTSPNISINT